MVTSYRKLIGFSSSTLSTFSAYQVPNTSRGVASLDSELTGKEDFYKKLLKEKNILLKMYSCNLHCSPTDDLLSRMFSSKFYKKQWFSTATEEHIACFIKQIIFNLHLAARVLTYTWFILNYCGSYWFSSYLNFYSLYILCRIIWYLITYYHSQLKW